MPTYGEAGFRPALFPCFVGRGCRLRRGSETRDQRNHDHASVAGVAIFVQCRRKPPSTFQHSPATLTGSVDGLSAARFRQPRP